MPAVLKPTNVSVVVGAVVVVAVAILAMMLDGDQPERLRDQQRIEQQQRDQSVAYYVGNYDRCGKATCP